MLSRLTAGPDWPQPRKRELEDGSWKGGGGGSRSKTGPGPNGANDGNHPEAMKSKEERKKGLFGLP